MAKKKISGEEMTTNKAASMRAERLCGGAEKFKKPSMIAPSARKIMTVILKRMFKALIIWRFFSIPSPC